MRKGKLPQYIVSAIRRRAAAAEKYNRADSQVSEYCKTHGIDTVYIDGNVETLMNPNPDVFIRDLEECLQRKAQKGVST